MFMSDENEHCLFALTSGSAWKIRSVHEGTLFANNYKFGKEFIYSWLKLAEYFYPLLLPTFLPFFWTLFIKEVESNIK